MKALNTTGKRQPPGLYRAVSRIANVVPIVCEPNDDEIAQYLLHEKKALITKKKEHVFTSISGITEN